MNKSPKQTVAERFGSRAALVKKIMDLLGDDRDGRTEASLLATRNSRLLRIHEVLMDVKSRFGSKSGLIEAIAKHKFSGRKPDGDYITKLQSYSQIRLHDLYRQVS